MEWQRNLHSYCGGWIMAKKKRKDVTIEVPVAKIEIKAKGDNDEGKN